MYPGPPAHPSAGCHMASLRKMVHIHGLILYRLGLSPWTHFGRNPTSPNESRAKWSPGPTIFLDGFVLRRDASQREIASPVQTDGPSSFCAKFWQLARISELSETNHIPKTRRRIPRAINPSGPKKLNMVRFGNRLSFFIFSVLLFEYLVIFRKYKRAHRKVTSPLSVGRHLRKQLSSSYPFGWAQNIRNATNWISALYLMGACVSDDPLPKDAH